MASGTQLFLDIMARDHASATFNKVAASADALGRHTDKAGRSHTALGKAARWAGGMLSVYGVAQYLKSSVQEYAAAETAQNKLGRAYEKFPAMQNRSLESFKALNTELMAHTRFDDDDTAVMQANLARFDLTGSKVQSLTPLIADLAQAQGTDMVTAGKAFGKATLGNTRALKDLGISYTATGDRAKDLRNVIKLLNEKVGGEAANAAGTSATKLEILENQLGELKETSGEALQPLVTKLAQVAGPAIEGFGDTIERNMPQIEQTFEDVWHAGSKIAGVVKGIWDAFSAMPPGVRDTLLLLGGGTMAYGKLKGSALGTGISSIFSGVKTITAGNVTVVGKTVTGTPGGGKPGGGLPGLVTKASAGSVAASLGLTGIILAVNSAIALGIAKGIESKYGPGPAGTKKWMNDTRGSHLGDGSQRGFQNSQGDGIRQPNLPNNSGRLKGEASGFREVNRHAKETADTLTRLSGVETKWGQAAASASLKGTIGAKGFAGAVKGIPDKKHTSIKADGADQAKSRVKGLGGAIGGLKGKTVKVAESGADPSRSRVKGLGGAIGGLKGKTVSVKADTSQAITGIGAVAQALTNLDGRTANTYVRQHNVKGAADGGLIRGPGTSTSDSIDARLSDGEYVIRARAVAHYGVGTFDRLNAMRFAKGGPVKRARKDAHWQDTLAKAAEKWSLDEDQLAWLSSLDRKVARKFIPSGTQKEKRKDLRSIKALTRQSNAVGARSDMQAAQHEFGAWSREGNFASKTPEEKKAAAEAGIEKARQAQRSKNAKVRAKGLRDEIEWTQKLNDAQQALKDAEAERAAQAEEERQQREAAEDAQLEKVNQLRDAVDNLAGGYRSFASISTTAVTDVTEAQSKLTDANDAVAAAQKKMDLAGSDRERAAAAAELSKALADQQTAQQGVNEAGKPTSASIRGNMAAKLAKIKGFSTDVKKLKDQGLNATTLSDILAMGPEQGADFAKALLDGGLGDINELQNQITQESASLGYFQHGQNAASDSLTGYAAAQAAGLVSGGVVMAPAPVTVSIDGNAIAQALISYKRQNGGSAPGLNL